MRARRGSNGKFMNVTVASPMPTLLVFSADEFIGCAA